MTNEMWRILANRFRLANPIAQLGTMLVVCAGVGAALIAWRF